jgi:hypothetical protein
MQKGPPQARRALFAPSSASFGDATERARQPLPRLLWRGWREPFALAARLWFRFGLRRLLNFLLAFVFASHASSVTQKGRLGKDKITGHNRFPILPLVCFVDKSVGPRVRLRCFEFRRCSQRFCHFAGNVVLDHEQIVEWPVVGLRPGDKAGVRANQPRRDAHSGT